MKLSKLAFWAALCSGGIGLPALAQTHSNGPGNTIALVGHHCDCGEAVCGCETVPDCGCETSSGCETDCCDSGCDSGCDGCGSASGFGSCLSGSGCFDSCCDCCLGDPYTLFGECGNVSAGGWLQAGYFNKGSQSRFNSYSDKVQLQQAWVFAEKALDTSCGFDIGGRVDFVYGTDGPDTQAFGTGTGWDNGWDNGAAYGSALPQLYGEVGYGDLSIKAGHFFTIIGWEVVAAPDNFFYSHAYTMYNSEPFTHTGALATYNASDDVTIWGGYVLGWDSGFDDNGDAFLGGASLALTDDLTLIYAAVGGRFAEQTFNGPAGGQKGYMHSIVLDYAVCDDVQYIFQSDFLDAEYSNGDQRDSIGVNNYLIKTINDCWAVGARFEWWNTKNQTPTSSDVFDLTFGVNYRPHANVILRPEVRFDWDSDRVVGLDNNANSQTSFAMDGILTF